jgi:Holliday junction resolvase RusA-like endonuclease
MHWAERNALQFTWDMMVLKLVREESIPPMEAVSVELTAVYKVRRRRDPDNVMATLKVLLDALVKAGVLPDDSMGHVTIEPVKMELDRHFPHIRARLLPVTLSPYS